MIYGWVEYQGKFLCGSEADALSKEELMHCSGEFYSPDLGVRDKYGIYPCQGSCQGVCFANPVVADLPLEEAIVRAVHLRSQNGGAVTLSGGVDSSLVAVLSGLPAVCVGAQNSADVADAVKFADRVGIDLHVLEITEDALFDAVPKVLGVLPNKDAMSLEIALAGFFASKAAHELGADHVLTGQAADELFAGYARYSGSENLRRDLDADFALLGAQRERDAAAAALNGVWYSLPYMDTAVVNASRRLCGSELVDGEMRKVALRRVAEQYLPKEVAWKPKKAMQYGSGVSKMLARLARREGVSHTSGLIELFLREGAE